MSPRGYDHSASALPQARNAADPKKSEAAKLKKQAAATATKAAQQPKAAAAAAKTKTKTKTKGAAPDGGEVLVQHRGRGWPRKVSLSVPEPEEEAEKQQEQQEDEEEHEGNGHEHVAGEVLPVDAETGRWMQKPSVGVTQKKRTAAAAGERSAEADAPARKQVRELSLITVGPCRLSRCGLRSGSVLAGAAPWPTTCQRSSREQVRNPSRMAIRMAIPIPLALRDCFSCRAAAAGRGGDVQAARDNFEHRRRLADRMEAGPPPLRP